MKQGLYKLSLCKTTSMLYKLSLCKTLEATNHPMLIKVTVAL